MGRERATQKYECNDCYYGCKGHEWIFEGSTTSMTAQLLLDDKNFGHTISYDDANALMELLNKLFVIERTNHEK